MIALAIIAVAATLGAGSLFTGETDVAKIFSGVQTAVAPHLVNDCYTKQCKP